MSGKQADDTVLCLYLIGVIQTSLGQSPPCDQAGDASHADLQTVVRGKRKEGRGMRDRKEFFG